MGIDRDQNGVLDGDEPEPDLEIARAPGGVTLNWPYGAAGFALEASASLEPAAWTNVPDPLEILGSQNFVTNFPSADAKFYRLRAR